MSDPTHPKVLVVDDEPGVGMIFSKILAEQGLPIHHCVSAEDALSFIQTDPTLKLVFLDIRLPGIDGIQALPKFLQLNPSLNIVMMTAYQTVESIVTSMKVGAVDFLVKPLNPQMIMQAVQKYGQKSGEGILKDLGLGVERVSAGANSAVSILKSPGDFIAQSDMMKNVLSTAEKFASVDGPVLILGESGTGKELLAHYLHQKSQRVKKPFVIVDCASIPETLFESELFGYEKGAFTGADTAKAGRFELAHDGSLFLDEIGNVPLTMQAKLLRFIENHTVSRLGGKKTLSLDIRLIAATNADLKKSVEKGTFREDLYYRLSTLTIHLPPLRNRPKEEKEYLVRLLIQKNAKKLNKKEVPFTDSARQMILDYPWPGNVRELDNALYSGLLLCDSSAIDVAHFPVGIQSYQSHREDPVSLDGEKKTLKDIIKKVEKDQILSVLKQTNGNKKKASEILDMDYKTFLSKLKEYTEPNR